MPSPRIPRPSLRLLMVASLLTALVTPLAGCADRVRAIPLAGDEVLARAPVELCGSLALPDQWLEGTPVNGLSDLALEADTGLLYLLSDRGRLHRARPLFDNGQLSGLTPIDSQRLRDARGQPLAGADADAESLTLLHADNATPGDTEFWVSFERDHRLQRFAPDGTPLAAPIRPPQTSTARRNQGMEAMTRHPTHGLILGLEAAPAGVPDKQTRLFSLDGKEWHYPLAAASGSALTELTTDGDELLALERAFAPPAPLVISLRRVRLGEPPRLNVETLASFSSADGWWLDNMEGMTRLDDGRVLILSDDNARALQRSLLVCLRPR
ncbi:esterase-like activity of phytase family protein [Halomonas halmophila]|nr:esterase-like activity of phytase family protein [Halomonas halmophila]